MNPQTDSEDAPPRAGVGGVRDLRRDTTLPEDGRTLRAPWRGTETSREAARRIEPASNTLRGRVLGHLIACGEAGSTDEEAEGALGIKPQTYTRRRELVMLGLVIDSGRRRRTDAGRSATVWVAVRGRVQAA